MDNITHSLAGWALGQAGLKTKTRKGLAALILGANMPDIDVFFQWAPWAPLATHRGVTHSLVGGVLLMPPILCGLLLLLDRWQVHRGTEFRSKLPLHRGWLLALCYLGTLTHPLLDLQTTYSVQLFSPFSNRWYHSDSLFIIDVWLWVMVGGAIAYSKLMEKRGAANWRRPVQAALGAALAYIGFNLGLSDSAAARVRQRDPAATAIFASPPPILFWNRDMAWRDAHRIGRAQWHFVGGLGPSVPLAPDNMTDPAVRAALRQDPRLRKFLLWSILPLAKVDHPDRCTARVTVADARYGLPAAGKARLYRETLVPLCAPSLDNRRPKS